MVHVYFLEFAHKNDKGVVVVVKILVVFNRNQSRVNLRVTNLSFFIFYSVIAQRDLVSRICGKNL